MFRTQIIILSIPAGLAAGVLGWLAAGGASGSASRLDPLVAQVASLQRAGGPTWNPPVADIADLANLPVFTLTTGPAAVPQPVLRLDGLVRSRFRTAALLSVNDRPAEWMGVGETRDGVTLQEVMGSRVVVDTAYGTQEVLLSERPQPATPQAGTVFPPKLRDERAAVDGIPPGFRSPPPPANAPRPH